MRFEEYWFWYTSQFKDEITVVWDSFEYINMLTVAGKISKE